jgi:hypothetical protein
MIRIGGFVGCVPDGGRIRGKLKHLLDELPELQLMQGMSHGDVLRLLRNPGH